MSSALQSIFLNLPNSLGSDIWIDLGYLMVLEKKNEWKDIKGSLKLFIWKIRGHNFFVVPIKTSVVYIFKSTFLYNFYLKHTGKKLFFKFQHQRKSCFVSLFF